MVRKSALLVCVALSACAPVGRPVSLADQGVEPVNVPVVTSTNYVYDAAAPGGALGPGDVARLDGWFEGLGLTYGDTIYVDGAYAPAARNQVAALAGRHGMLIAEGAPVTEGMVQPGSVRVVVARRRASVPGCPNWSRPSEPDFANRQGTNFGCAINSNLAAEIADPQDLVHGREAAGVVDPYTSAKAVNLYRSQTPTGTGGLKQESSKGGN
ncbi:MAG TPA: CpaD family pilus assembly lipoprotein [Sphingomicrobium sp.]|jgi:pilus assembly protein CpaD